MAVTAYSRGNLIIYDPVRSYWFYPDTKEVFNDSRPCKKCGRYPTKEGYDACLGFIENVDQACCGHGVSKPYIMKKTT